MARLGHIVSRKLLGVVEDRAEWYPRCRKLHDSWQDLRRDSDLPRRADFDPVAVPDLLPDLFLIDIERTDAGARRYRYRLVGTGNVDRFGRDNTGLWLDEAVEEPHLSSFLGIYERVAESAVPICEVLTAEHTQRRYLVYQRLLLPLASDGKTPDVLLGLIVEAPN